MRFAPHTWGGQLRCVAWVCGLISAPLVCCLYEQASSNGIQPFSPEQRTKLTAAEISTAIENYEVEFSQPPRAATRADYVQALEGNNPRKIVFFEPRPDQLDKKGEFVDGWGKPFELSVELSGRPIIISPSILQAEFSKPVQVPGLYHGKDSNDMPW